MPRIEAVILQNRDRGLFFIVNYVVAPTIKKKGIIINNSLTVSTHTWKIFNLFLKKCHVAIKNMIFNMIFLVFEIKSFFVYWNFGEN